MELEKGILGNTIRKHRIMCGMSQEELAEAVDITPTHLKHIESEHRKPSIEVLFRLVDILHISLDEILLPHKKKESSEFFEAHVLLEQCTKVELLIVADLIRSFIKNRNQTD